MIGIDTNVLVRFLTNDDPAQARAVHKRLQSLDQQGEKALLSKIVVLEAIWVLSTAYELDDTDILAAITQFAQLAMIRVEDPDLLSQLQALYSATGPGLADQCILADYIFQSCDSVITFDKKAQRLAGFAPV